ncbi:endogenous retrovirus group k member 7 gag poly [Limosa lapponica baueri]|uniref:Endogenous retrovirus group k member 7 gag poly n=1 Tax=Limosa lapponica baueri TaxID=1758121 RepID=A0A2I0UFN3_LIMLA|nr:endogenous retrovirus group k member 7 gag poly [Limosa lapponica baueri]
MAFIDRLRESLDEQVPNEQARNIILLKLSVEDANTDCQRVLRPLENPNLILELCNWIGSVEYKFEAMAAAFATMKVSSQTCFGCGKPGHLKKHCHNAQKPKLPNISPRCKKGGHYANQCCSKYYKDGKPLSGNCQWSVPAWNHARTQVAPGLLPLQTYPACVPEPAAAPEWTWQPPNQ